MVELWVFRNEIALPDDWHSAYSQAELLRSDRYRDSKKREQFLVTRAVGRRLVASWLRCRVPPSLSGQQKVASSLHS